MIFKNLFKKKKWLSEKVSERLAAVAELEIEDNGNKAVLHELAFNDGDEKVRRATLEKLNEFSLWWQAFKNDASDNIKKMAEKAIVNALTGRDDKKLDPSLKQKFVQECNKSQLLEQVVFELDDDALALEVLQRLNRDNLIHKGILESRLAESAKLKLLNDIEDINQLKKLAKKLTGTLLVNVEQSLEQKRLEAELPVRLEKQARLLLAQLNALKDKQDYCLVQDKQNALELEWKAMTPEFTILSSATRDELEGKYLAIGASLERILQPLKQAWQQEQAELERAEKAKANFDACSAQLTGVESRVTAAIANDEELDQASISSEINSISSSCNELVMEDANRGTLLQRADSLLQRASQVPKIKESIEQAKALLLQLKSLEKPANLQGLNEVEPEFKQIRNDWKSNLANVGLSLPADIANEYDALHKEWHVDCEKLLKEQRQLFNQARRKLAELEGLIKFGKFHNAFGLFKKLSFWIADLNAEQQAQLARKWEHAQEEIEKLHELERSFSNPKKQELLEDIRKIAETPLVDPSEQAHRVRLLRSNWQSLGHAGDEQEDALNSEFDKLCEQAFEPCREHYKALEDERNSNLAAKELIIAQLKTLADNLKTSEVSSWRDLESVFVKLTRLWRETGLIDRERVADINRQYQASVAPIKQAIAQHHKDNEGQKRLILQQAETLVAQEIDIKEKSERLKQLQGKWQKVGFAGKSLDQKLWNEFRAINAPVFEQRDSIKQDEIALQQKEFARVETSLNDLIKQIEDSTDIGELRRVLESGDEIFGSTSGLNKSLYEKLRKLHHTLAKQADSRIATLRDAQEQQVYVDLFDVVESLANGKPADTSSLKPAWQSALNTSNKLDRKRVTLMLEITAGKESPENEKAIRNEVQMEMLSQKLEQGIEQNLHDLLELWLGADIFTVEDIQLAKRIESIFVK